jgi:hypothetical protein
MGMERIDTLAREYGALDGELRRIVGKGDSNPLKGSPELLFHLTGIYENNAAQVAEYSNPHPWNHCQQTDEEESKQTPKRAKQNQPMQEPFNTIHQPLFKKGR